MLRKLWNMTHLTPLAVVAKHFLIKPVTVQYPEEKLSVAPRFKGRHIYDRENCLGCMACARACPNKAIHIEAGMVEVDGKKKKVIDAFTINMGRCMFCGLCVDACPKGVLERGPDYELAACTREELVYGFDRLDPKEAAEK